MSTELPKTSRGFVVSWQTRLVWSLLFLLIFLSGYSLAAAGISLAPWTLPGIALPVTGLLTLSFVYTHIRPDPRIADLSHMAGIMLVCTTVAAILSYTAIALWHPPLIDEQLVAFDRALGLDWPAMWHWVVSHYPVYLIFYLAYSTLIPQMILLLVLLNFLGLSERCWELIWLFIVACLGCLIASAIWPAVGAFGYFHVQLSEPYLAVFQALRDGTLKVIEHGKVQGIVTFPSLHATLGMIFIYATRGIKILFPVFVVLNVLLIMATPFIGGHHFADLAGAVVLTALTILLVRRCRSSLIASMP